MTVSKISSLSISSISKIYGIELSKISSIYGQSITPTWLTGWDYRKSITLSRASGAVTNYQMKVFVGESSGATGEDVDCGGKCKTDFSDLRFTTSDKTTLLDYWIESVSGTTPNQLATIWVEFDNIGTDATTFYMYYGNSGASAYSNGTNTFPFFDHFEGTSLDANKWNLTGSVTTSSSEVTLDGSDQIYGKTSFGLGYTLRTKVKANEQDSIFAEWWIDINNRCSMENSDSIYPDDFDRLQYSHVKNSNIGTSTYLDNTEDFRNTYAIYEVFRNSSSSLIRTKYGSSNTYSNEYTNSTYIITSDAYPSLRVWNSSQESTLIGDWVLIRKQVATEPAWGSWGTEENKWLDGWLYRKPITLSRASGAVTDYQMKVLVSKSASATGEDVDCNGNCLDNFDDLRFTTDNGVTLLDYWIESISSDVATIWVEFDSIGTSDTTFYMYYGNSGASAYSNGANTFILFDDFERGADGDAAGGSWTTDHCFISTASDIGDVAGFFGSRSARLGGAASPQAYIAHAASDGAYAIDFYCKKQDGVVNFRCGHGNGTKRLIAGIDVNENVIYYDGSWRDTSIDVSVDTWVKLGIRNISFASGTFDIYIGDSLVKTGATMHTATSLSNAIYIYHGPGLTTVSSWFDNFVVRNWRDTEPAWGSWGTEETN